MLDRRHSACGHDVGDCGVEFDPIGGLQQGIGVAQELLLDGELVAAASRSDDFYARAPLAGQPRRPFLPVSSWTFDLLYRDGELRTGRSYAERRRVDIHVLPEILEVWDGNELLKTVKRTSNGVVRKKRAQSD